MTRWSALDGGAVALWSGDAGYDTSDHRMTGTRHRLWMVDDVWRFERD